MSSKIPKLFSLSTNKAQFGIRNVVTASTLAALYIMSIKPVQCPGTPTKTTFDGFEEYKRQETDW